MKSRVIDKYPEFVNSVMSPKADLAFLGLGIAGEGGEFADEVKKIVYHNKRLDFDLLDKEAGDSLWYIQAYCIWRGTTIEELMRKNMEKLRSRYPDGFVGGGGIRDQDS